MLIHRWVLFLFTALLTVGLEAHAQCGTVFESCGDGVDNDCDGSVDEGCTVCTPTTLLTVPWNFSSLAEIRNDTNAIATNYGRSMDVTWGFLPSHRISSFGLNFSAFSTETNWDFFVFDGQAFHGNLGVFPTPLRTVTAGLTNIRFLTDPSVQRSGGSDCQRDGSVL